MARPDPRYAGPQETSGLAIASLILSCLSFIGLGPVGSLPGVILGHMGRRECRNNPYMDGDGLALAGLIVGYINLAMIVAGVLIVGVIFLLFFLLAASVAVPARPARPARTAPPKRAIYVQVPALAPRLSLSGVGADPSTSLRAGPCVCPVSDATPGQTHGPALSEVEGSAPTQDSVVSSRGYASPSAGPPRAMGAWMRVVRSASRAWRRTALSLRGSSARIPIPPNASATWA